MEMYGNDISVKSVTQHSVLYIY